MREGKLGLRLDLCEIEILVIEVKEIEGRTILSQNITLVGRFVDRAYNRAVCSRIRRRRLDNAICSSWRRLVKLEFVEERVGFSSWLLLRVTGCVWTGWARHVPAGGATLTGKGSSMGLQRVPPPLDATIGHSRRKSKISCFHFFITR